MLNYLHLIVNINHERAGTASYWLRVYPEWLSQDLIVGNTSHSLNKWVMMSSFQSRYLAYWNILKLTSHPTLLKHQDRSKIYSMWLYIFLNWPFRRKSPHIQNGIFGFFISRVFFFFFPSEWLFNKHVSPLWNKNSQLQYLSIRQMFRENFSRKFSGHTARKIQLKKKFFPTGQYIYCY